MSLGREWVDEFSWPNDLFLVAVFPKPPELTPIRETDMALAQRGEPHGSNVQMRPWMYSLVRFI